MFILKGFDFSTSREQFSSAVHRAVSKSVLLDRGSCIDERFSMSGSRGRGGDHFHHRMDLTEERNVMEKFDRSF